MRRIENRLVIKKLFRGIYVLMSHKNTFLYEKILVWLLEYAVQHNIQVLWHHFMADFELAVKHSIQYIFGDILQWHGCYLFSFWASNSKKDSINRLNNRIQR